MTKSLTGKTPITAIPFTLSVFDTQTPFTKQAPQYMRTAQAGKDISASENAKALRP